VSNRIDLNIFLRKLFSIAFPIAMQSLLISSVNFADTFMIGRLGENSIAAVTIANQVYFLVMLLMFGITSGVGVFVSQFWGKKDIHSIYRVMGIAISLALTVSTIIGTAAIFFPKNIISLFTNDAEVISLGASYLFVVAFSYPFTAMTFTLSMGLRSTEETVLPLVAAAVSLSSNVLISYTLIFGLLGFPQMGVVGAAIGTLIARSIEIILLLSLTKHKDHFLLRGLGEIFTFKKPLFFRVMTTAFPVILNELGWSLGIIFYNGIFSRISTEAIAARQISDTAFRILLVLFIGIGNATHIMIGKSIGEKKYDQARTYAHRFTLITPLLGIFAALVLLAASGLLPLIFNISPLTRTYVQQFIIVIALVFPFKALTLTQVVGIFRGGGDTAFSMMLDVGGVWLIGVSLAFYTGLVLQLPVFWVFLLASSEEIVKAVIGLFRTYSGKWLHDLTNSD
jgi:putative MATE family efflux protein